MGKIEDLCGNYESYISLPWEGQVAGAEKVIFAVYDKMDERRLRKRVTEFEIATQKADHQWDLVDLTGSFAEWMSDHKYKEMYFENPDDLSLALNRFRQFVAEKIRNTLQECEDPENTVVAVLGAACLFGFVRVSEVLAEVQSDIRGRLLVFFPGSYEDNIYRLLDARDGWNYMAVPITPESEVAP